jgi:hypothetical protein
MGYVEEKEAVGLDLDVAELGLVRAHDAFRAALPTVCTQLSDPSGAAVRKHARQELLTAIQVYEDALHRFSDRVSLRAGA